MIPRRARLLSQAGDYATLKFQPHLLRHDFETVMFHQLEQIIKQFEKHGIKAKRQLTSTKI